MKALSIKSLTKTYDNGNQALKGIDLSVEAGDFYALLGPNGAGKTTAIGIVSSLVNKSGGEVEVFGHSIDSELDAAKSCIGLVPQEVNLNLWETCWNIVRNQAGYYGLGGNLAHERTEKYLRALRLWDRRDDNARSLSGGMKRRLMIARAIVSRPRLLLIDGTLDCLGDEMLTKAIDAVQGSDQPWSLLVATGRSDVARQFGCTLNLADNSIHNNEAEGLLT